MRQMGLFTVTELAAMRDRTSSRRYSPTNEQFRREHARHRAWGLAQRHAEKLRRVREHRAEVARQPDPPPSPGPGTQRPARRSAPPAPPPAPASSAPPPAACAGHRQAPKPTTTPPDST